MSFSIEALFEIEKVCFTLSEIKAERVVVQLSDCFVEYGMELLSILKNKKKYISFYLIYETTCSPCCLDLVSANHVQADAILHYGPRCNNNQNTFIKTLSFFGNFPISKENLKKNFLFVKKEILENKIPLDKSKTILFIDTAFLYSRDWILNEYSKIMKTDLVEIGNDLVNLFETSSLFEYECLIFVGKENCFYNFLIRENLFSSSFVIDPIDEKTSFFNKEHIMCEYSKRFSLIEASKNKKIFGFLIDCNSTTIFSSIIQKTKKMLQEKGKNVLLISVGGITIEKIANFSEVDVFVNFSCSWSSYILNQKITYYRPIITVSELLIVFNQSLEQKRITKLNIEENLTSKEFITEKHENFLNMSIDIFNKKTFKGI